jgi:glycosyltransferase involved in cell wall biosynthesis
VRVLLVEPYFGGSHRQWAEGFRAASGHDVHLVTHDARFWKWRMEGGHVTLAAAAEAVVAAHGPPDALVASDMVNLPAFLGAARRFLGNPAIVLYMHENQLTYPVSHLAQDDLTHAVINWASVDTADAVWFNSPFHLGDFFSQLPELLGRFPDYRHTGRVDAAVGRSSVMPVGIDLSRLDEVPRRRATPPLVLWNQRWEHDKNPEEFFAAIDALVAAGADFRLALAGEAFGQIPGPFEDAKGRLADRIVHFGFAERPAYDRLLRAADVVVSTSLHEFFGVAVVEAIYAGAWPVLPNRLAYPDHIPERYREAILYDDTAGLIERLSDGVSSPNPELGHAVSRYDWRIVAPAYDAALEALAR